MKSFHVVGLFQAGPQLGVVGDNTVATQDTTSSKMQRSVKSFMAKRWVVLPTAAIAAHINS